MTIPLNASIIDTSSDSNCRLILSFSDGTVVFRGCRRCCSRGENSSSAFHRLRPWWFRAVSVHRSTLVGGVDEGYGHDENHRSAARQRYWGFCPVHGHLQSSGLSDDLFDQWSKWTNLEKDRSSSGHYRAVRADSERIAECCRSIVTCHCCFHRFGSIGENSWGKGNDCHGSSQWHRSSV